MKKAEWNAKLASAERRIKGWSRKPLPVFSSSPAVRRKEERGLKHIGFVVKFDEWEEIGRRGNGNRSAWVTAAVRAALAKSDS